VTAQPTVLPIQAGFGNMIADQTNLMTWPGDHLEGPAYFGSYVSAGSGSSWTVTCSNNACANPQYIGGPPVGGAPQPVTFYFAYLGEIAFNMNAFYKGEVWNDLEYVTGQNRESAGGILITHHSSLYNHEASEGPYSIKATEPCNSWYHFVGCPITLEAAPGEGFGDTLAANPNVPLVGYDANLGVAIRGVNQPALYAGDNIMYIKRLQLTSTYSNVIAVIGRDANNNMYFGNLMEGGTGGQLPNQSADSVSVGGGWNVYVNNLIITKGFIGIWHDYGGVAIYNTFVCRPADQGPNKCAIANANTHNWIVQSGLTLFGNAVFGFQHFQGASFYSGQAMQDPSNASAFGIGNATDLPATDANDFPNNAIVNPYNANEHYWPMAFFTGAGAMWHTRQNDGSYIDKYYNICAWTDPSNTPQRCEALHNVSPSAAFVSWPNNLRPNPNGPLIGTGITNKSSICTDPPDHSILAGRPFCIDIDPRTPDLFGQTRPTDGRYDVGAVQYNGVVAPPSPPVQNIISNDAPGWRANHSYPASSGPPNGHR
jgi:hypothetical protein